MSFLLEKIRSIIVPGELIGLFLALFKKFTIISKAPKGEKKYITTQPTYNKSTNCIVVILDRMCLLLVVIIIIIIIINTYPKIQFVKIVSGRSFTKSAQSPDRKNKNKIQFVRVYPIVYNNNIHPRKIYNERQPPSCQTTNRTYFIRLLSTGNHFGFD